MREITLRAITASGSHWVYGDVIHLDDETLIAGKDMSAGKFINGHVELQAISVYPPSIGQSTGLIDMNGKEIYEGDVIRTEQGIAKVIWCDAAFALESPGSEAVDWEHSSVYEKSEIIGNIHQNPELL